MPDFSHILNSLGEGRERYQQAVVPPIFQSSNFAFKSVAEARAAFQDELSHTIYSRGNNPTTAILRQKLAALEGAEDALVLSSGSAAIAAAVLANVKAGDHIICVQKPYSWTFKLLDKFLPRFNISHTFVDGRNMENIQAALRENTTVLLLESPNSLSFELQDLRACGAFAKKQGLVSIIDNSYCSPYYQNPIELGIEVVVHSGSKYLNGHSDVIFGAICSHKSQIRKIFQSEFMTLGTNLSPHDAWLALRGLRSLPLRMEQVQKTALDLVARLEAHPKVDYVLYPWADSFPQRELARQQMRGAGGLFSVNFKFETIEEAEAFADRLEGFQMAVSWGGYEALFMPTCVFHNMPTIPAPDLPFSFVRFSVGLESADYLWGCLEKIMKG